MPRNPERIRVIAAPQDHPRAGCAVEQPQQVQPGPRVDVQRPVRVGCGIGARRGVRDPDGVFPGAGAHTDLRRRVAVGPGRMVDGDGVVPVSGCKRQCRDPLERDAGLLRCFSVDGGIGIERKQPARGAARSPGRHIHPSSFVRYHHRRRTQHRVHPGMPELLRRLEHSRVRIADEHRYRVGCPSGHVEVVIVVAGRGVGLVQSHGDRLGDSLYAFLAVPDRLHVHERDRPADHRAFEHRDRAALLGEHVHEPPVTRGCDSRRALEPRRIRQL